nr:translation initiation factor IF-2-like [Chlorocebus sabaeus]
MPPVPGSGPQPREASRPQPPPPSRGPGHAPQLRSPAACTRPGRSPQPPTWWSPEPREAAESAQGGPLVREAPPARPSRVGPQPGPPHFLPRREGGDSPRATLPGARRALWRPPRGRALGTRGRLSGPPFRGAGPERGGGVLSPRATPGRATRAAPFPLRSPRSPQLPAPRSQRRGCPSLTGSAAGALFLESGGRGGRVRGGRRSAALVGAGAGGHARVSLCARGSRRGGTWGRRLAVSRPTPGLRSARLGDPGLRFLARAGLGRALGARLLRRWPLECASGRVCADPGARARASPQCVAAAAARRGWGSCLPALTPLSGKKKGKNPRRSERTRRTQERRESKRDAASEPVRGRRSQTLGPAPRTPPRVLHAPPARGQLHGAPRLGCDLQRAGAPAQSRRRRAGAGRGQRGAGGGAEPGGAAGVLSAARPARRFVCVLDLGRSSRRRRRRRRRR